MENRYDLRKLIQRTYDNIPCDSESERAAVTIRIFDVEKEVNLSELGAYRKADIVSVIESAFENREKRMLAKTDNLESIVQDKEQTEVAYGKIKDCGISISKILKYALFGALPEKLQIKLAKRYGEDPLNYTAANIFAESVAYVGLIAYLTSISSQVDEYFFGKIIPTVSLYSLFNFLGRFFIRFNGRREVHGSTLCYNGKEYDEWMVHGSLLVSGPYKIIEYALSTFKKKYIQKKEELTKWLKPAKSRAFPYNHLEALGFERIKPYIPEKIESSETKQLPPPERKSGVNWKLIEDLLGRKISDDEKKEIILKDI